MIYRLPARYGYAAIIVSPISPFSLSAFCCGSQMIHLTQNLQQQLVSVCWYYLRKTDNIFSVKLLFVQTCLVRFRHVCLSVRTTTLHLIYLCKIAVRILTSNSAVQTLCLCNMILSSYPKTLQQVVLTLPTSDNTWMHWALHGVCFSSVGRKLQGGFFFFYLAISSLAARLLREVEESQEFRAAGEKGSDVSLLCWNYTYQHGSLVLGESDPECRIH